MTLKTFMMLMGEGAWLFEQWARRRLVLLVLVTLCLFGLLAHDAMIHVRYYSDVSIVGSRSKSKSTETATKTLRTSSGTGTSTVIRNESEMNFSSVLLSAITLTTTLTTANLTTLLSNTTTTTLTTTTTTPTTTTLAQSQPSTPPPSPVPAASTLFPTTWIQANPDASSSLLKRLNATEIREHFERHPLQFDDIPFLLPKPDVDDHDMVAIYSRSAWQKLHDKLININNNHNPNNNTVTLVVSGGSTLAGGGNVATQDRAHNVLVQHCFPNLTIVDRAHGGRSSYHTTQLMHSFFPMHPDIVLWEFAINDAYLDQRPQEQRNFLVLYLEQVAWLAKQRHHEPPLVILLYLWDVDFMRPNGLVHQTSFEAHRHLGEQFDFVVGQVNAAKYFESWHLGVYASKAVALADEHHPNARGHMILAYLLNDLIMNEQRPEKPKEQVSQTFLQRRPPYNTRPSFTWLCGNETDEKLLVRDLFENRHPVAAYTDDQPKNDGDVLLSGMLPVATTTSTASSDSLFVTLGKQNPLRQDRRNCRVIPCCQASRITFDVSSYSPIKGLHFWSQPNFHGFTAFTGFTVFADHENITTKLISSKPWGDCFLQYPVAATYDWIVFEQEQKVSEISLCDSACSNLSTMALSSVALYGGK